MLAQLLSCYQNVFSQSDREVEQIELAKLSIVTLVGRYHQASSFVTPPARTT